MPPGCASSSSSSFPSHASPTSPWSRRSAGRIRSALPSGSWPPAPPSASSFSASASGSSASACAATLRPEAERRAKRELSSGALAEPALDGRARILAGVDAARNQRLRHEVRRPHRVGLGRIEIGGRDRCVHQTADGAGLADHRRKLAAGELTPPYGVAERNDGVDLIAGDLRAAETL